MRWRTSLATATSPVTAAGQPPPVQPEVSTVPTDDCLRLDDDEGVRPARPQLSKGDPEGSVGGPDERARRRGGELLAKGEVLEQEIAAGTEARDEHPHRHRHESKHGEERLPCPTRNINESLRDDVLANDKRHACPRVEADPTDSLGAQASLYPRIS